MTGPASETLDARGLKCPLPVLKLEKKLATMAPGAQVIILADDPVARVDIPLLCSRQGHTCTVQREADHLSFTVVKNPG